MENSMKHLEFVQPVTQRDCAKLMEAEKAYKGSWKKRGGIGVYMMLARKWDRIENVMEEGEVGGKQFRQYDLFQAMAKDQRAEGLFDDIRDLRRYLTLVEAQMIAEGLAPDEVAKE